MLTLEEVKKGLEDMNLSKVAKACDLHKMSVYRLMKGEKMSYETVEKLSNYLEERNNV